MNSSNQTVAEKVFALTNSLTAENKGPLKEQLTAYINDLITNDFPSLVQLLYRVDIDEKKLKTFLQQKQDTDAAAVIADLLAERLMQKKQTKQASKKSCDTSEDELW